MLALTWFAVSAAAALLFAIQIHALVAYRQTLFGRGMGLHAALAGLLFAGLSSAVVVRQIWRRRRVEPAAAFVPAIDFQAQILDLIRKIFGILRIPRRFDRFIDTLADRLVALVTWGRRLVRRAAATVPLFDFFVTVFFALLATDNRFRWFMFTRMFVDAVIVWQSTYKEGLVHLPWLNRDLAAVIFAIVGATAGLGLVYNVTIFQFLINGLVVGSIYVLGATGLSLIFGIRKFANFAHGEMMTFGAYMALLINGTKYFRLDILWGLVVAVITTAILAMLLELIVFRKLAGRGPVPLLVASIGVALFLQNLVAASFGTEITGYNLRATVNIPLLEIDGQPVLSLNPVKGIATLVASTLLIVGLHVLLKYTTLGKAMRATADNPDLARASGINIRNVILWTWAIGGALAAIAGVLLGISLDVRTTLGFSVLLFVFAAVIVGGLGSPYGAMLGGFIVGIAQELSVPLLAWLGRPDVLGISFATAYKPVAAFLIMILVLLVRPGGLGSGRVTTIRTHGWRLPQIPWGRLSWR